VGFSFAPLLPLGPDETEYRLVTTDGVDPVGGPGGRHFLTVTRDALTALTVEAMHDIAHYLRPAHLTKAQPDPARMMRFLEEKLRLIGTAACPPYHLAIVVGGTSAEYALKRPSWRPRSIWTACRHRDRWARTASEIWAWRRRFST
jgi:hypothetical protein